MCRKFLLVISFVMAVGLIGTARAGTPIDVNNSSFEKDVNGVQITTTRSMRDVGGWTLRATGAASWAGGWWYVSDEDWGIEGYEAADGTVSSINVTGYELGDANSVCKIYQILEDTDAVIAANKRYTLTFNAIRTTNSSNPIALGELFYNSAGEGEVNDVVLASESRTLTAPTFGIGYEGWEEIKATCTIPSGSPAIGESLGVKVSNPYPWIAGYPVAMDNVRVEWDWATSAFNPDPEDGEDNVSRTKVLTWSPGIYVASSNGHQVYLGTNETAVESADTTDTTGIYRGAQTAASYDAPQHPFALGATYYWRVDEVNDAYSGTEPPPGPWTGPVWSFTITGYASNPSPVNGAIDVDPEPVLSWTTGTDATAHAVYLGTNAAAVESATSTDTTGIYKGTQATPDVDYAPAFLTLGATYYWRIDAKNAAGTLKGDIWQFTVNEFELIDDFESYANDAAMEAAWNDYWYGPGHTNHGYVWKNTDTAFSRDGNSMKFTYSNGSAHSGKYYGSYATGLESKLPVGPNWTADGIKVVTLYFYGTAANAKSVYDRMYVKLTDGATPTPHTGIVRLPDMNDVQEEEWHEWNIQLSDPAFSTVVKTNIAKITIGFGGADGGTTGKGGAGTMYFDDIRLNPTRCVPQEIGGSAYLHSVGDFTTAWQGGDDCTTDIQDLALMAQRDWLMAGYDLPTTPPPTAPLVQYQFSEGSGTITANSGSKGASYNITFPAKLAPVWTASGYVGSALVFNGAEDYLIIPPLYTGGTTTQYMTITAWIKPTGLQDAFPGIVVSREGTGHATGFGYGGDYSYNRNQELCYFWNDNYWDWHSELYVPINIWSFVALTVEPNLAVIYLDEGTGPVSKSHVPPAPHGYTNHFTNGANITTWIARDNLQADLNATLDDVRIYGYALTASNIANLTGHSHVYLQDWRADINNDDKVNLIDFSTLADHWLDTYLWP
jgi:hypothetical protein